MKIEYLQRQQFLPIDPDLAWAFLSNPANLLQLTPPEMDMQVLNPDLPKAIYPGFLQVLQVRPVLGIPVTWVAEITQVDAPFAFIDTQKAGPFSLWHHRHQLRPTKGGVDVIDEVYYALPFGVFGQIAGPWVRQQLTRQFDYRAQMMREFFGA